MGSVKKDTRTAAKARRASSQQIGRAGTRSPSSAASDANETAPANSGLAQRVQRLLRLIIQIQCSRRNTADTLAAQLGVSRRTVFRDLNVLHEAGVPLANAPGYGYRLDPDFNAALQELGDSELLGLMLLDKVAEALPEQPLLRPAHEAVTKIIAKLPSTVRGFFQEKLRNVTFAPGAARFDSNVPRRFVALQQAIEHRTVCDVIYNPVEPHPPFAGRIHPLHLHFHRHSWYVLAFSEKHEEVRMFNLSRFQEIGATDDIYSPMPFSIDDYLDDAWGIIPGDRKYNIKIRFNSTVARNVAEIRWHRTQEIEQHHDGSCTARFRVNGLDEIKWWILSYGGAAEVIEPVELRDKIADMAAELMEKYHAAD